MEMTPYECAKMWYGYKYHNAASLRTLAELNACSIEEMRMTLLEAGVNPKGLPRAERKKKGEPEMAKDDVKMEAKTEEKSEVEPEYNFPPAPKYPNDLPKVWRLEEIAGVLNSVFVELCGEQVRAYEANEIDEIRGMYGIGAYCDFQKGVLAALTQNASQQLRTEE